MSTPDPMLRCPLCGRACTPGDELPQHVADHEQHMGIKSGHDAPAGADGDALALARLYVFHEENRSRAASARINFEVRVWYERKPGYTGTPSGWSVVGWAGSRVDANIIADSYLRTRGSSLEVWTTRQLLPHDPARMLCDRHGPTIEADEESPAG